MEYSADIKTFDALRRAWYEATLSTDDEKRLYALATRLLEAGVLEGEDRSDAMMLAVCARTAACSDPHYKAVEFAATLDRVVTPHRRKTPLLWISAAACTALLAGIGFSLLRPSAENFTADKPTPSLTAQVAAPRQATPAPAAAPSAAPQVSTPTAVQAAPVRKTAARTEVTAVPDTAPAEQAALREITDPDEASCLISQTCLVLGSSLALAQNGANGAITELEINLNSIN